MKRYEHSIWRDDEELLRYEFNMDDSLIDDFVNLLAVHADAPTQRPTLHEATWIVHVDAEDKLHHVITTVYDKVYNAWTYNDEDLEEVRYEAPRNIVFDFKDGTLVSVDPPETYEMAVANTKLMDRYECPSCKGTFRITDNDEPYGDNEVCFGCHVTTSTSAYKQAVQAMISHLTLGDVYDIVAEEECYRRFGGIPQDDETFWEVWNDQVDVLLRDVKERLLKQRLGGQDNEQA